MADNDNNLVFTVSSDMTAAQRGLNKFIGDVGAATDQIAKKYQAAGAKIESSTSALQTRINGMVGLGAKASKEWTGALADQGAELERLRARYSPLFSTINQYKKSVGEIRTLYRSGAIGADEYTAAMARQRREALANIAALKGKNLVPGGSGVGATRDAMFRRQNLGYQAFDVGQGLASGMPLGLIAAQQSPQIAQLYAGNGGAKALLGDVGAAATGVVTAVGALPVALAAAGTAAILYAKRNEVSLKSADEIIKKHRENILSLGDAYGIAEAKAKAHSAADRAVATAATQGSLDELNKLQVKSARELRLQFGSMQTPGKGGQAFFNLFPDYKPFADAFRDLDNGIRDGRVEGEKFIDAVSEIARVNPQYDEFANKILKAAKQFLQINTEVSKTKDLLTQVSTLSRLDPLGAFDPQRAIDEKAARTPSLFQQQQAQRDALRQQTFARSPAEREAAARAAAAAQFNPDENPTDRENRIATAGYEARLTAEHQIAEAQRERARGLQHMLADQQNEIDLIGKTGGAAEALRKQYELIAQLKEEAARNGTEVDQAEIAAIKEKTKQLGQYVDLFNKMKLSKDLADSARFNSLSQEDQQIVTTLRQYGLSEDLSSNEAGQIRSSIRTENAREELRSFFGDFKDALIHNGGDIGKAFAESIQNALLNEASKLWDKVFDQLINSILSGGGGQAAANSGSGLGAVVSAITGAAPVTPVTRAPLGDISASTDVASYIAQAAAKRGIDPATALAVARSEGGLSSWNLQSSYFKNGVREPSFGPFQLYKGGGLGNDFMAKTGLDPALAANGPAGVDFALDYASKNGWGAWYGAGKAGIGNMQGIGAGSAADAVNKLAESAGAATKGLNTFGGGLGQLGQSLSTSFFPAAPSGGGGGGLFSWLGSLFSGPFVASGPQAAAALAGTLKPGLFADGGHVAGPGGPTDDSIPAWLSNGEFVVNARATKKHRAMLEAINTGRVARFASGGLVAPRLFSAPSAPALAPRMQFAANDNGNPGVLVVRIDGANGDDHVRTLVRQGVGEGLSTYNEQQRRGGFGTLQSRYNAQKG